MSDFKIPTETVSLPSKGLVYSPENPLSKGSVEMKYMTAKEEDILTNANAIKDGTVIDKLLKSLIVSQINYDDLIIGDKDAILIAARILGYGKDYNFQYINKRGEEIEAVVDLQTVKEKEIDLELFKQGINEFTFTLPNSANQITFKILTHGDEKKINEELKALKRTFPNSSFDVTTRLKHMITSVNGKRDLGTINEFVDKALVATDARALRNYVAKIQPGVDIKYYPDNDYTQEGIEVPIGLGFFWPDLKL